VVAASSLEFGKKNIILKPACGLRTGKESSVLEAGKKETPKNRTKKHITKPERNKASRSWSFSHVSRFVSPPPPFYVTLV